MRSSNGPPGPPGHSGPSEPPGARPGGSAWPGERGSHAAHHAHPDHRGRAVAEQEPDTAAIPAGPVALLLLRFWAFPSGVPRLAAADASLIGEFRCSR